MNERREDLKKWYKVVKTCRICKEDYGTDCDDEVLDYICPVCSRTGILHRLKERMKRRRK